MTIWQPQADEKCIDLNINFQDVPDRLYIDAVRLRQCVSNLVSNAVKFTEQGSVDVEVSYNANDDEKGCLVVSVTDSGPGISQAELSKLFNAFEQTNLNKAKYFGGTGLGLNITRQLARLMGGDVSVSSVEGEGSTFKVWIDAGIADVPARTDASRQSVETIMDDVETANSDSDIRILVVDDNEKNRLVVKAVLGDMCGQIDDAVDGQEALDALEDYPDYDLVLLDIRMPNVDGSEVLRRVRSSDAPFRDVPIIVLTADAFGDAAAKYTALGADGYAAKPLDISALYAEVIRVLSSPVAERPLVAAE